MTDDNLIEEPERQRKRRSDAGQPRKPREEKVEEQSEIEFLRAELKEMKAMLAQAALQKLVKPPIIAPLLHRKIKPDPLIEMLVDDKGKGKIATGGVSGFERYEEYGVTFKTPLSSGRLLWNRNYATPVDRAVIPRWERENRKEETRTLRDKQKLDLLLDEANYDESSQYGSAT